MKLDTLALFRKLLSKYFDCRLQYRNKVPKLQCQKKKSVNIYDSEKF